MPIFVDHQLQEQIPCDIFDFPIAFYCDELADLPTVRGPCTGTPASRSLQRKTVSWTTKWDKPIQFWNRETASLSTQICSTESDRCPALSQITCQSLFFLAQSLPQRTALFIRNTSSRFFRVTLCPVLCSDTITVCGRMFINGLTLRIAPCGNSPIVTSWWFSATSAMYWKQSFAILILCQNPKHHGYN